jgi:retron-type reverse transcriptase
MKTFNNSRYYSSFTRNFSTGLKRLNELRKFNNSDSTLVNRYIIDIAASPDVLLFVYGNLKAKFENITFDIKNVDFNVINFKELNNISRQLKNGKFQFKAIKTTYNKNKQSLGVVLNKDMIVQEAICLVLKAIFAGNFSSHSYGFSPFKNKHAALQSVYRNFGGAAWVLEGEISGCFDAFDYKVLIKIIVSRIQDNLFLDLICKCFKAGYINLNFITQADNVFFANEFILTPIFFNLYFDSLDKWVEKKIKNLKKQEYEYEQLNYVRYASKFLIASNGSKKDCFLLKNELLSFLTINLKVNLGKEKIKIIHAKTEVVTFLETLVLFHFKSIKPLSKNYAAIKPKLLQKPKLLIPIKTVIQKLEQKGFCRGGVNGIPTRLGRLIHLSLEQIICVYIISAKTYLNYYSFANNYFRFRTRLLFILEYSLALTFASKLKLKTKRQVFCKFGYPITIQNKNKKTFSFDTKMFLQKASKFGRKTLDPDQTLNLVFNSFRNNKQFFFKNV